MWTLLLRTQKPNTEPLNKVVCARLKFDSVVSVGDAQLGPLVI